MHRRLIPAVAAALLTVGALSACTGGGSGGSTATSGGGGASGVAESGVRPQAASAGGSSAGDAAAAVDDQARSIVTTGRLNLVADSPVAAADAVRRIVAAAGGRVGAVTEDPSGRASARLELRIPAARFDDVLASIEREGEVRDVSTDATDVTAQVTDYAVRIENLRTSIDRLRALLAKATDSDALVTIESALTERQTSLEQLLAQQRDLADRVTYATLSVSIVTPEASPAKGPGDFLGGLATGTTALVQAGAAALVGFGLVLPWLAVLAALGGVALLLRRTVRRRTRPTSA